MTDHRRAASSRGAAARERLLAAAERHFAERGYRASLRDITRSARCNVAAVNYYFGAKEGLYAEAVIGLLRRLREEWLAPLRELPASVTLEEVIGRFAQSFVASFRAEPGGIAAWRLLQQELIARHLPAGALHRELVGPVRDALVEALTRSRPGLTANDARRGAELLLGQLHYLVSPKRLDAPDARSPEAEIDAAASLAAAALRTLDPDPGASVG